MLVPSCSVNKQPHRASPAVSRTFTAVQIFMVRRHSLTELRLSTDPTYMKIFCMSYHITMFLLPRNYKTQIGCVLLFLFLQEYNVIYNDDNGQSKAIHTLVSPTYQLSLAASGFGSRGEAEWADVDNQHCLSALLR